MTTIAYRNKCLASDSKISDYDTMSSTYMTKIFKILRLEPYQLSDSPSEIIRREKQVLVGIVGDMYTGLRFIKWLKNPNEDDKAFLQGLSEDYFFEAIVVDEEGNVSIYNNFLEPLELGKIAFYALGSGAKIAMALLDYGVGLETTLEFSKKYDMNTGGETHIVSFNS